MAQFFPTFENKLEDNEQLQIQTDGDELDELFVDDEIEKGDDEYCFYFLVDRSISMGGRNMTTTKEALKLFMQSLPRGCKFHIISFGSDYQYLGKSTEPFQYNNANL